MKTNHLLIDRAGVTQQARSIYPILNAIVVINNSSVCKSIGKIMAKLTKTLLKRTMHVGLIFGATCFSFPSLGADYFSIDDLCMRPFVGIDVQGRHLGFQKNYGDNFFPTRTYGQYNVYGGIRYFKGL